MDELISIIVLILYLVAAGAAGKKKKQKKARQQAKKKREAQFEQAFEKIAEAVQEQISVSQMKKSEAPRSVQQTRTTIPEGTDPCHAAQLPDERPSMRLGDVSAQLMDSAGEGEDPCHTGYAFSGSDIDEDSQIEQSPIFDAGDPDAFARDVLRGVIMSEVLARPAQRRTMGLKRGT